MGNSMKTLVFAQKVQLIMEKNSVIVHHLVQLALELLIVVTVVLETSNSMEILALAQKAHLTMAKNFAKIVRPTASLVLKVQQHAQVVMKIWFYLTKNVKELSMV